MKFPARFSVADSFDGLESPVSPGCAIGIRVTIICNVEKLIGQIDTILGQELLS